MMASDIAVIITAAGTSSRMGGDIKKEYLPLLNGTVISSCAKEFLKAIKDSFCLRYFVVTVAEGCESDMEQALFSDSEFSVIYEQKHKQTGLQLEYVRGGKKRQDSVFNALEFLKHKENPPELVLIHDGARPWVTARLITDVIVAAQEFGAAVPGIVPVDTQKQIDADGFIVRHLERKSLCSVQTPQGFEFERLYQAHKKCQENQRLYTDDSEIWGEHCGKVKAIQGDMKNLKITYPNDLKRLGL